MVIVLLIIAIVLSGITVFSNLGSDGGYVTRDSSYVTNVDNSGGSSGVRLVVESNGVTNLVMGVMYGF